MSSVEQITGKKILVTGVTGWVAGPLAESLAAQGNTVYGAARFKDPDQRQPWHDKGVQTVSIDLAKGKNAVEVANGNELVNALVRLQEAVLEGLLDAQIEQAADSVKARFAK